jgi:hypothetical protein
MWRYVSEATAATVAAAWRGSHSQVAEDREDPIEPFSQHMLAIHAQTEARERDARVGRWQCTDPAAWGL